VKNLKTLYSLLLLSTPSLTAIASDIATTVMLESTAVLPKGVRNFSYKGITGKATDRYNNAGEVKILADPFFKKVTFGDVVTGKDEPEKRGLLEGLLKDKKFDEGQEVGQTTGNAVVSVQAHAGVFAYGVTDNWTLATIVPVIQYKTSVDTGFFRYGSLENLSEELRKEGKTYEQVELRNKMEDPIKTKLDRYGYKPLVNEQATKLGDIRVVSKHRLYQDTTLNHTLLFVGSLTLPTGEKEDIDKIIDVKGGDGQTDVGLGLNYSYQPSPYFKMTTAGSYNYQFGATLRQRVWEREDSKISRDIDDKTSRKYGNITLGQLSAESEVVSGLTLSSGYTFQMKESDKFSGSKYDSVRYRWMEANTFQLQHDLLMKINYSTLPMFKAKKFPVPLMVALSHTIVLDGKNVTKDPRTSVDFAMFF
jgi:hypothetical protein